MDKLLIKGALIILTIIWCIGWFLTKEGLNYSTPFSFTAARFTIGSIIMLIAFRIIRGRIWPSRVFWPAIAFVGFFQTTLMYTLSAYGLMLVDIGRATILIYATPIWAAAFGPLILGERATPRLMISVGISCLGISLVVLPVVEQQPIFGFLMLILSSFCWAVAMLITKKYLKNADQFEVVVWQTTFGAMGLVLAASAVDGRFIFTPTLFSLISLLYVAVFGTIVAMSLWFFIIQRTEMIHASLAVLTVPVIVMLIDGIWFNASIDAGLIVGSILILSAVLLVFTEKRLDRKNDSNLKT